MTRVILVRHGQTAANAEHRLHGQTNTPLNDTGRQQAQKVANWLKTEPVAAVYASDLDRAYHTAEAIAAAHGLPVEKVPELREIHLGEFENLLMEEILERSPNFHADFHIGHPDWRVEGGESVGEVRQRVSLAIESIAARHPAETVVIVAHGGALGYVLCEYLSRDFQDCMLKNTGFSVLEFSPEGIRVLVHNSTDHLLD